MPEKNELIEEELEKVNGGFEIGQPVTVIPYSFEAGECFGDEMLYYKVRNTYTNVSGDTFISVIQYNLLENTQIYCYQKASILASRSYLGKK